jgi:hypothetical protein
MLICIRIVTIVPRSYFWEINTTVNREGKEVYFIYLVHVVIFIFIFYCLVKSVIRLYLIIHFYNAISFENK